MFTGRIGLAQYWLSVLVLILIGIAYTLLVGIVVGVGAAALLSSAGAGSSAVGVGIAVVVATLLSLVIIIPSWGLAVRRYHDVGLSAWVLVGISVVNMAMSLVFPMQDMAGTFNMTNFLISLPLSIVSLAILVWPGKKGENKFGAPTKYSSIWAALKGKKPELPMVVAPAPAPAPEAPATPVA